MKTRTLTIKIEVSGEEHPSDDDMMLITAAATSALNSTAIEKGFTLDNLVVNCPSNIEKTVTLKKYKGSTYFGEKINHIVIYTNGKVLIVTKTNSKTFDVGLHYVDTSADYILCALQDEEGINVSKY